MTRDRAPRPAKPAARRGVYLKTLRRVHGWLGLWGAVLGMLFGLSGIVQNHRAVLKLDMPGPQVDTLQLQSPADLPRTPEAVAAWMQRELGLTVAAERVRQERAQTVVWGDVTATQPARWLLLYRTPAYIVQAEFWPGSGMATAKRSTSSWWGVVQNFHRANGVGIAWVLLSDTIAGSLIALSITGLLLWTEMERRKLIGLTIFAVAATVAVAAIVATYTGAF
ncbi:PepSY-associated TM helix domain-containing protein [Schauerella aestuarii]|uniref:PepSY-associated TM helix domain-containing protein n=1 Tax=Schauerella aestuarii TaxID=2511204 RepID=UPI00136E8233|nr:PepSY-associated TM helix domain-containing protein [Achromobacter aestuarii]MYZ42314.1 peptidase [Achromobacter aestuarii]